VHADNQGGESVNQDGVDGLRDDRLRLRDGTSESLRALFGPPRRDDESFDVEDPGKMRFNPRLFSSLPRAVMLCHRPRLAHLQIAGEGEQMSKRAFDNPC